MRAVPRPRRPSSSASDGGGTATIVVAACPWWCRRFAQSRDGWARLNQKKLITEESKPKNLAPFFLKKSEKLEIKMRNKKIFEYTHNGRRRWFRSRAARQWP